MARTLKTRQKVPAEQEYADELAGIRQWDRHPVPPGWEMSPVAVEAFILGHPELGNARKFVCEPGVVKRIVVALCTNRGALLIGEPGTAKSLLSELITAAVSGDSSLIVQGGAITSINQLLYSWNEGILRGKGPCVEALVPSPMLRGMQSGRFVRFEELARCPQPLQDSILSILSDRVITIPELAGEEGVIYANEGFNIIATSNSVDEGVNRMSAALKRRMNFETIRPIGHIEDEVEVVRTQVSQLNVRSGVDVKLPDEVIEMLVTIFHELRTGQSLSGRSTDRLAGAAMSTAEAVTVAQAVSVNAYYYHQGEVTPESLMHFILGSVLKDNPEDRRRLLHYFESEVAEREGDHWQRLYQQRGLI